MIHVTSTNNGVTWLGTGGPWPYYFVIDNVNAGSAPRMVQLSDGRIVATVRDYNDPFQRAASTTSTNSGATLERDDDHPRPADGTNPVRDARSDVLWLRRDHGLKPDLDHASEHPIHGAA